MGHHSILRHHQYKMKCVIIVALLLCFFEAAYCQQVPRAPYSRCCPKLQVSLNGNVYKRHKSKEGFYELLPDDTNDRAAWKSGEYYLMFGNNDWKFTKSLESNRKYISTEGTVGADYICPDLVPEDNWLYFKKGKWKSANGDITIECYFDDY